ncbi:MAG TPA: Glu/Leu/Phe/Val dehydrogenase dimerization domain-containing protein, partial [Chloroflexota bacterium]|nr:Glu/Leu/Phe/Val dehydrogenase dimerization domain-containing protein [Chloroflexota bacterium]
MVNNGSGILPTLVSRAGSSLHLSGLECRAPPADVRRSSSAGHLVPMRTMKLTTVDAYIAFDMEVPTSAGGTRLAPDVTEREAQLLARAMTYKFAVLGANIGGAKGAIRAGDADRDQAVKRYVDEIRPLVEANTFLTSTDLGTKPEDFASLPDGDQASVMHSTYEGMPLDAFITGLGVTVAAETALGGSL